jgi:hypothetical protein
MKLMKMNMIMTFKEVDDVNIENYKGTMRRTLRIRLMMTKPRWWC